MQSHTQMCPVTKYTNMVLERITAQIETTRMQRDSQLFSIFQIILVGTPATWETSLSYCYGSMLMSAASLR
jgi:hypothetical protein